MPVRNPDTVQILVRIVGNNEFVTDTWKFRADVLRTRTNFSDVWEKFDRIITTRFHQDQNPAPGQVLSRHPPTIVLQETTSDPHKWKHTRWSTFNWDDTHKWPPYFERNVLKGNASTLFVELHIGWGFIVPGTEDKSVKAWSRFEEALIAAGHGDANLEEKILKRVIVEGRSHRFIEDTWNTARTMPHRAPVEVVESCVKCQAAADAAGSFSKLKGRTKAAMAEWEGAKHITTGMGNISVGQSKEEPADIEMTG